MTKAAVMSAEDRQFNKNKWIFSISGIGRDMSYQLISTFLLVYIQYGVTLNVLQFTVISLLIGVVGRIWDALNDPLMGAVIEGTHMKMGKFRPWILIGALTCGAMIITMFNVQSLSGWNFVVFIVVMYLLWESTFTMNDISYWSMLASLTSKKEQRNSVTMLTVIFAAIGAFIAQGGITFLYPGNVRNAFRWISIGVVAIFVTMQVICALFVKERPRSAAEQSEKVSVRHMFDTIKHNDQVLWMTLVMLFYNIGSSLLIGLAYNLYYLEIGYDGNAIFVIAAFGVANVLAQVFYPKLAAKLGRRKLQTAAIIVACVGYLGIGLLGWTFLPFNLISLTVCGVLVFIGQSLYYMACIINMTNCVEYNEYKRGERNEAVVSTLRPFMAKFADAVKYGIVLIVLTVSGVYLLSQNISTLEEQKNYFQRMSAEEKIAYAQQLQDYYFDALPEETQDDYDDVLAQLNDRLEKDEVLSVYKIQASYLPALKNIRVAGEDGRVVATLSAVDTETMTGKEIFLISGTVAANGEDFNVANENFKALGTSSMRVWVRIGVSVLPTVLLIVSLIVQKKKFFIDEEYYDKMLSEIEQRKQNKEA